MTTAKIALVGDRSPSVRAHGRIPLLIDALRRREGLVLDPYWIPSTEAEDLEGFDGIWVVPGSPYRDPEKVVAAVSTARTHEIPFLGTCGGFQHAILHLARDVAGIEDAHHAEYGLTETDVIVQLECSLVGHEGPISYTPDTLMARIAGVERSLERYHCAYGISPSYVDVARTSRRDLRRPRRRRRAARAGAQRPPVLPRHALPARAGRRRHPRAPGDPGLRGGYDSPRAWKK